RSVPSAAASSGAPRRSARRSAPSAWSGCACVRRTATTTPSPTASATASRCVSMSGPGSITTSRRRPTRYVRVPSSVIGDGFGARTLRITAGRARVARLAALGHQDFGQLVRHRLDRLLVLSLEGALLVAVDVDLAEDLVAGADQDD